MTLSAFALFLAAAAAEPSAVTKLRVRASYGLARACESDGLLEQALHTLRRGLCGLQICESGREFLDRH